MRHGWIFLANFLSKWRFGWDFNVGGTKVFGEGTAAAAAVAEHCSSSRRRPARSSRPVSCPIPRGPSRQDTISSTDAAAGRFTPASSFAVPVALEDRKRGPSRLAAGSHTSDDHVPAAAYPRLVTDRPPMALYRRTVLVSKVGIFQSNSPHSFRTHPAISNEDIRIIHADSSTREIVRKRIR